MNKQELIKDIVIFNGGGHTISRGKLAAYLKISRNSKELYKYIHNLKYIPGDRNPKFFVSDVAERILENTAVYLEGDKAL